MLFYTLEKSIYSEFYNFDGKYSVLFETNFFLIMSVIIKYNVVWMDIFMYNEAFLYTK